MHGMPMDPDAPTGNTPGVIGAQEVYRDPRSKREVQQHSQTGDRGGAGDRLSFKDKMKIFDGEAGENLSGQRPKLGKLQRALEESLSYGNGRITSRSIKQSL